MTDAAGAFGLALAASMALVPAAKRLSERLGAWDFPDGRKLHDLPMPRLGGLAVWGAFCAAAVSGLGHASWGLLAGGTMVWAAGAWEDARGLSAYRRLGLQLAGAALAVGLGAGAGFWSGLPGGPWVEKFFLVLWLAGLANAFNFLDGIDGEAGSLGALMGVFLAVMAPIPAWRLAAAGLAGACLGFLPANWRPAKIFLGDGGSTVIGFTAAALAASYGLVPAVLLMGLPLADLLQSTVTRIRSGRVRTVREWLEATGKDHLHHILLDRGYSVPGAVAVLCGAQAALGLAAFAVR